MPTARYTRQSTLDVIVLKVRDENLSLPKKVLLGLSSLRQLTFESVEADV